MPVNNATRFAGQSALGALIPHRYFAVTLHDTNQDPNGPFIGLWVAAAGTIRASMMGLDGAIAGATVDIVVPSGGVLIPGVFVRIHSTGTTIAAANILGAVG